MENPTYLGDGVYAYYDGLGIELRLDNHESHCVVYMEPQVIQALANFVGVIQSEIEKSKREN